MIPEDFYKWIYERESESYCFAEFEKRDAVISANKLRQYGYEVKIEKSIICDYYFVVVKREKKIK